MPPFVGDIKQQCYPSYRGLRTFVYFDSSEMLIYLYSTIIGSKIAIKDYSFTIPEINEMMIPEMQEDFWFIPGLKDGP